MNDSGEGPSKSLYVRLGGYDAIAAIIDNMLALLKADPRFTRFGTGRSTDSHKRPRQLIVDQICSLAGGPCYYTGRDMKTSHLGLAISEAEWRASIELTSQALQNQGIPEPARSEFIALFERYRSEIVEV